MDLVTLKNNRLSLIDLTIIDLFDNSVIRLPHDDKLVCEYQVSKIIYMLFKITNNNEIVYGDVVRTIHHLEITKVIVTSILEKYGFGYIET